MKQIIQNFKTGTTEVVEIPVPLLGRGQILVRSSISLISTGTERLLVDFGKASWLEKARQQPEKVKQVLDKIRTDGLLTTVDAILNKLDEPMPLGYCNSGVILDVGEGITDLKPGDRVASNGSHAEFVCVPRNLCAKIPDEVTDEEASFTVLGSIALQGVRLAMPTLGEHFIVFGLGLIGLLTVQFLRASGCPVLAVDMSESRLRLAEAFGAETADITKRTDPIAAALSWTGGKGVDGAIIAASAKGDEIMHQAAQACRKRGRIILVGVVDLNLRRTDYYEKEITFQVSCSYGPGRYDEMYEKAGQDYPFGFVRWTEQRNFEAVLEAMRAGQLRVKDLITHRLPLDDAVKMYDKLLHDPDALGIIIEYPGKDDRTEVRCSSSVTFKPITYNLVPITASLRVGVIGAGNYARSTLLPALVRTKAKIAAIADINGMAAAHVAKKFKAENAISDYRKILDDPGIQAVFVLVGHHLHARFVCESLEAGKHVFVEKPLCLNETELNEIIAVCHKINPINETDQIDQINQLLMVGFNRRFSSHTVKIKELLRGRISPLTMNMTVNAGFIPPEHWTQDPERGGGRIIGEACHFIDLLSFIAGSPVASVSAMMISGKGLICEDKMSIIMSFSDGSIGTVHYFANGSKSYPKETLEVFGDGRVLRMENFRITKGYGFKGFSSFRTWRQDKGHRVEISSFVDVLATGSKVLIPFDSIVNVTRASFAAVESARTGKVLSV